VPSPGCVSAPKSRIDSPILEIASSRHPSARGAGAGVAGDGVAGTRVAGTGESDVAATASQIVQPTAVLLARTLSSLRITSATLRSICRPAVLAIYTANPHRPRSAIVPKNFFAPSRISAMNPVDSSPKMFSARLPRHLPVTFVDASVLRSVAISALITLSRAAHLVSGIRAAPRRYWRTRCLRGGMRGGMRGNDRHSGLGFRCARGD